MLELDTGLQQQVVAFAQRRSIPGEAMLVALEREDVDALARLLGQDQATLAKQLTMLTHALQANSDWGAGCKLLTDDVRAQVTTTLGAIINMGTKHGG